MSKKTSPPTKKIETPVRVCLIGFMGAGKTAAAQVLAEKTGASWIDLDEFIEARESRAIADIFENLGEGVFREIETDALKEILRPRVLTAEKCVIALGGGAWTTAENRERIKQHNFQTFWLDAPFELCWQRIANGAANRPLAQNETAAREIFEARREIYGQSDFRVRIAAKQSPDKIAAQILKLVRGQKSARQPKIKNAVDKTAARR